MDKLFTLKNPPVKELAFYFSALVLCGAFLYIVLHLWSADFRIPFAYSGDAINNGFLIKGTIENGWYMSNPFTGMPFGSEIYDYPLNCNLDISIIKIVSLFSHDWALTMNLYYLLTFPLTAVTSLFTLRKMGVSPLLAIAGSLLFTFLPFHFMRGELHLWIAAYYLIPLIILVVFYLFEDNFLFGQFNDSSSGRCSSFVNRKNIFSLTVCILTAAIFVYYGFFTSFFLLVAGGCAAVSKRKWMPLFNSLLLIGVIVLFILIFNIPTFLYQHAHGVNELALVRNAQGAEIYGLKVIQLLLPIPGHRFPLFAAISRDYAQTAPLANENQSAALGIIGSIGFIILIIWIFYRLFNSHSINHNETWVKINQISTLNLAAVLLGTIGGIGAILSYAGFTQIRSYNRISVFIAFYSILAVVLLLDFVFKKYPFPTSIKWLVPVFFVSVFCLGIYDQTSPAFIPDYYNIKTEYLNDQNFVQNIEKQFPADDMIFQLPYVPFPENDPVNKMKDYDLFRGYLHSTTIRWSYGIMKGRDGDSWQKNIANKPLDMMTKEISLSGFNGVYVDSYGYTDSGKELVASLTSLLGVSPLVSDNGRLYFFDMAPYNAQTVR
jgi:hypothetical protein